MAVVSIFSSDSGKEREQVYFPKRQTIPVIYHALSIHIYTVQSQRGTWLLPQHNQSRRLRWHHANITTRPCDGGEVGVFRLCKSSLQLTCEQREGLHQWVNVKLRLCACPRLINCCINTRALPQCRTAFWPFAQRRAPPALSHRAEQPNDSTGFYLWMIVFHQTHSVSSAPEEKRQQWGVGETAYRIVALCVSCFSSESSRSVFGFVVKNVFIFVSFFFTLVFWFWWEYGRIWWD